MSRFNRSNRTTEEKHSRLQSEKKKATRLRKLADDWLHYLRNNDLKNAEKVQRKIQELQENNHD